jgi:hypothetical protein
MPEPPGDHIRAFFLLAARLPSLIRSAWDYQPGNLRDRVHQAAAARVQSGRLPRWPCARAGTCASANVVTGQFFLYDRDCELYGWHHNP